MKKLLLVAALVVLAGCDVYVPDWQSDQKLRQQLFTQCLGNIPAGPSTAVYNDWAEVVQACEEAAYMQSRYDANASKPE
jgi:hypothetical protein